MIRIVLGCLFGDEGKGQCVHTLSNEDTLVIRFSGGHQCGHTVVTDDNKEHVFSQFGSGTLKSAGTYISEYCTIYPKGLIREYNDLKTKSNWFILDKYFVDPLAMITTPYDIAYNRVMEGINNHGTVGVGFGATIDRNEKHFTLYASDLLSPFITVNKINQISKYYNDKIISLQHMDAMISYMDILNDEHEGFADSIKWFRENIQVKQPPMEIFKDIIFEGSQGIMLDQKIGFFPHVTRCNTTALNAMEIIKNNIHFNTLEVYYVTRCYMTRHGNGPFPEEEIELLSDPSLSNPKHDWQGQLKTSQMNFDILEHTIKCNDAIMKRYINYYKKHLIVTCCDQVETVPYGFMDMSVDNIEYKKCRNWN